jgi:hypothetical protein
MINNGVDHVDVSQSDLSTLLPGSLDGDAQEPPGLSGLKGLGPCLPRNSFWSWKR